MAKVSKTKQRILSLSREEANQVGLKVEALMKKELAYIVNKYVTQYQQAAFETFGWERDDILQHIRVALWKGVATFNPDFGFKIETYLSSILDKTFLNLSRKCKTKKHSLTKLYCPENFYESEETIFQETGEDWVRYAQSFSVLVGSLNQKENKIMVRYLVYGESTNEISKNTKIKKTEVIKLLKNIKSQLQNFMEATND